MVGLIADIGGTSARFALADSRGYFAESVLSCADYAGPAEAAFAYLESVCDSLPESAAPTSGAFAIAGPVHGDSFFATNMPWTFSIETLRQEIGLDSLRLYNDFEAVALAVPHLGSGDVIQIGGGTPQPRAPVGVLGTGTGLGVGSLFYDGARYHAIAGEGGHVTLPVETPREFDVVEVLLNKYSHVSAERVCSGKGLVNLYESLRILDRRSDLPHREASEISAAAIEGTCPLCAEALDMMMLFLGRVAGNLALTLGAHGGIYVAGGIPLKLGPYFFTSPFRSEFEAKGRFVGYMQSIPTFLITHPFPAFLGLQKTLA